MLTKSVANSQDELPRIEAALDKLLDAAIARRRWTSKLNANAPLKFLDLAALCNASPVEGLLNDPIGRVLVLGVKALGARLHQLGGTDLMRRVLENVAARNPREYGRRISLCDHAWDMIGSNRGDTWVV